MVAYNGLEKLRAYLDSVAAQEYPGRLQTVLVENRSTEPVVATLLTEFSWVELEASEVNLGFAAGTNRAVDLATGELVLLLNPDTVLPAPDTLARYVAAWQATPGLGALGCRLVYPDGSLQVVGGIRPRAGDVLRGREDRGAPAEARGVVPVGGVTGAALLTSREVWRRVGPLDPRYFMYFEDLDWCRRAETLGLGLAAAADVTIIHHEGSSYGGRDLLRREHFWDSFLLYTRAHDGPAQTALLRLGLGLTAALQLPRAALARDPLRAERLALRRTQARLALLGR